MKYLFKVILLFLVIFNFHVPFLHYSATITVILCIFYYLFFVRSSPFTYFTYRYVFVILAATLVMALINFSITVFHEQFNIGMVKRLILQGYMICCVIFALPILVEEKARAFEDAILVICGAFALQGFIHTMGFLIAPVGDFLFSLQTAAVQEAADSAMLNIDRFRFYSLTGSPFFELPAAYGVACIVFFRLQLIPDQNYLRGWKAFVIILMIALGISLSGRTGFVGFTLGLVLYIFYNWNNFSQMGRNVVKISGGFVLMLVIFYTILTPAQRSNFTDRLLPFAFEAYYNWRQVGRFETGSTDALMQIHYYPLDTQTMLWGRGGGSDEFGTQFRHTDAGYMNNIIFGGIFYILLLVIYQFLYFQQPMKLALRQNTREGNIDFACFFVLFAYIFILESKGATMGTQHITETLLFYTGFSYLLKQYALEDMEDDEALVRSGELIE